MYVVATHSVLEECIPDILPYSGHRQDIALAFLVALNADAVVEHVPVVPNQLKGARRELALQWVGADYNHLLEQLHPPFVLVFIPECITIILL